MVMSADGPISEPIEVPESDTVIVSGLVLIGTALFGSPQDHDRFSAAAMSAIPRRCGDSGDIYDILQIVQIPIELVQEVLIRASGQGDERNSNSGNPTGGNESDDRDTAEGSEDSAVSGARVAARTGRGATQHRREGRGDRVSGDRS